MNLHKMRYLLQRDLQNIHQLYLPHCRAHHLEMPVKKHDNKKTKTIAKIKLICCHSYLMNFGCITLGIRADVGNLKIFVFGLDQKKPERLLAIMCNLSIHSLFITI